MNGLIKIPMQFFILMIGVLVFAFYQFQQPPVFFNAQVLSKLGSGPAKTEYETLEKRHTINFKKKEAQVQELVTALHNNDERGINKMRDSLQHSLAESQEIRKKVSGLVSQYEKTADPNDSNYIFLNFVTSQMPVGVIGLLIAIIFLAAMGSTASGLNSLASTTVVDFYCRLYRKNGSDSHNLKASRVATALWGIFCIAVAFYAMKLGNLIEAVNILGSLFYGTILGIFLVAFYLRKIKGTAVFVAALIAEVFVVACWLADVMAFLWLNVLGCLLVILLAFAVQAILPKNEIATQN
jgi:hypothetical protein